MRSNGISKPFPKPKWGYKLAVASVIHAKSFFQQYLFILDEMVDLK